MEHLAVLWRWLSAHWAAWGIPAIVASIGGAVMGFLNFRKTRLELEKTKMELAQMKLAVETTAIAQTLQIYGRAWTVRYPGIPIPEERLREMLGPERALRLHAALEQLRQNGAARQNELLPDHWHIQ